MINGPSGKHDPGTRLTITLGLTYFNPALTQLSVEYRGRLSIPFSFNGRLPRSLS